MTEAAHTLPPWKIYAEEYQVHTGSKYEQYFIGTEGNHPQLKTPYPVVGLAYSCTLEKKAQTTLNLSKADAAYIVECCNNYPSALAQLSRLARRVCDV